MTDPTQHVLEAESEEELKERLEREHNELLQELRAHPRRAGALGFLLAISFTNQFGDLTDAQRYVYYATLVAPPSRSSSSWHPPRTTAALREGDKDYLLRKANREAIAGTVASSLALTGVLYLVTDLVFGTPEAVVARPPLLRVRAWRWWSFALLSHARTGRCDSARRPSDEPAQERATPRPGRR